MTKFGDILFLIGGGLIILYFFLGIFFPTLFKGKSKKTLKVVFLLPLGLIIISLLSYYITNLSLSKNSLPDKYVITRQNLDSLNKELSEEPVLFNKIDTIINKLQKNQDDIKKLRDKQLELQKRVRIDRFNEKISDSILKQIEDKLKEIKIKPNYSLDDKLLKHEGKLLTYKGRFLKISEKVFNDLYTIDSFEVFPILKKINFASETQLMKLNYYIDSVQIKFRIKRNVGKARNNLVDSILYLTISPYNQEYKRYKYVRKTNNETSEFLDSLMFHENTINKVKIDFPNNNSSDTLICFDFFLKRGLISSYCIPF